MQDPTTFTIGQSVTRVTSDSGRRGDIVELDAAAGRARVQWTTELFKSGNERTMKLRTWVKTTSLTPSDDITDEAIVKDLLASYQRSEARYAKMGW